MIIGNGIDIVDIERFTVVFKKYNDHFLYKFFTINEIEYSKKYKESRRIQFFAGRFAAKEAISKAFGCGFGSKLKWLDLEIISDSNGKPVLTQNEALLRIANAECHISISHEKKYAISNAILFKTQI